jgi:class 3 adenylate cyclase/tetratricopeptide (TPR) repeat protein
VVSAAAARKTVSVLFCDLAGSTALGERLDPEPLRELMGSWYEAMRTVVESHGGMVEKFVGDAVMAVFGLPRAHEDDALRAVRAALEMQKAAGDFVLRIGVNTGVVVTGDELTTLVTGDAVNTAKRLEQAAGGGEILVGAVTERLIRHAVRLEPLAPVDAKGKSAAVEAWRVLELVEGAEPFARRWDTPLVGRRQELAILRDELTAIADERSCRLVTVVGTAGVGKTRLASELADEVRGYATVLTGRCLPYGEGITFWPLVELLRAFGGDEAVAKAVEEEPDAALVVERLAALAGGAGAPEELFWAVRRLFEALTRRRPLVVVLEDVHWAEATLLDLVEHVSRWSRDAPILLLCIARPELLEERPRWDGTVVRLEPLSPGESSELLDALDDSGLLSPELRDRVAGTAQGNPLYAEQLMAMLAEGDGDAAITELPPTIQALLEARLDRLEPAERDVLERAAVVGKDFWPGAIAALGEGEEALGATLLELVRRELVEPAGSTVPGEDGFCFRHALIRDAAYASAPLRRRAAHHERFAEWLASGDFGDEYDEIRGHHLEQAVRLRKELGADDEHDRALASEAHDLLARAGTRAYARGDAPAARNLIERALALAPDAGDLDLRRILAHALRDVGATEPAIELVESVAAAAAAAGDRAEKWYARLDAATLRLIGGSGGLVAFLETASQAVEVFSELDDEQGLAQAWRRISLAERVRCSYAAAEAAAERAVHYALRCGDLQDAARAADALCTALLWGPTPVGAAIVRCEKLVGEMEGSEPLRANVLTALGGLRALEADFAAARRLLAEAEQIYRDLGLTMFLAGLAEIAAQVELLAGDPDAAETVLRHGLELLVDTDATQSAVHHGLLAATLVSQSRHDEARESAEAARAVADAETVLAQVVWRGALARVEAAAGNLDVALALAREGADMAALTDGLAMRAEALLDLAAVLAAAGDSEEAARVEREAARLYEEKGRVTPAPLPG